MDPFLVWGLALLGVAAILLAAEIFIPSAGIIAGLSGLSAIAGIVCLFKYDTTWGVIGLLLALILGPVIFFVGLNIWKNTEFGRRAIGAPTEDEIAKQALEEQESKRQLESLIGAQGVALTDLRPVGLVMVGGERRDALAETSFIAAGTRIKVTVVESHQLKVRPLNPGWGQHGDAGTAMLMMDGGSESSTEGDDGGAGDGGGDGGGGDGGGGGGGD
jgi:membrane-bound serine protease (ClpP class)